MEMKMKMTNCSGPRRSLGNACNASWKYRLQCAHMRAQAQRSARSNETSRIS